jgi:proline iminopeptidase
MLFLNKKEGDVKVTSAGVAAEGRAPLISTDKSMPDYTPEARSLSGPKTDGLRKLYPTIEPYETGRLQVDNLHEIYWEWSGKEDGYPVVFLHGGPGGGVSGGDRRWFDPSHYRVLCFDQRGAGQSTPPAELKGNTTWDLVADIEKLRNKFGIEKWHVFGGSWGSTLSLAYAQKHPERVSALILRGIFTLRKSELQYFYQDGASHIFPEQFKPYRDHIPEKERGDMIKAYYKRLTHKDEKIRLEAARKWSTWENATSKLYVDLDAISHGEDDKVSPAVKCLHASRLLTGSHFAVGPRICAHRVALLYQRRLVERRAAA